MRDNYQKGNTTRMIEFKCGIGFITRLRSIDKDTSYVGLFSLDLLDETTYRPNPVSPSKSIHL